MKKKEGEYQSERGEQGSAARAGLYLLIADVTVSSHSGHPTRGCIPRKGECLSECGDDGVCVVYIYIYIYTYMCTSDFISISIYVYVEVRIWP